MQRVRTLSTEQAALSSSPLQIASWNPSLCPSISLELYLSILKQVSHLLGTNPVSTVQHKKHCFLRSTSSSLAVVSETYLSSKVAHVPAIHTHTEYRSGGRLSLCLHGETHRHNHSAVRHPQNTQHRRKHDVRRHGVDLRRDLPAPRFAQHTLHLKQLIRACRSGR